MSSSALYAITGEEMEGEEEKEGSKWVQHLLRLESKQSRNFHCDACNPAFGKY